MWTICKTCGCVVADQDLHATTCHQDPPQPEETPAPAEETHDGD